jgi:hypothetical protein
MRSTGRYNPIEEFDIDHEINSQVDKVQEHLKDIDASYSKHHASIIKKAIAQTYLLNI